MNHYLSLECHTVRVCAISAELNLVLNGCHLRQNRRVILNCPNARLFTLLALHKICIKAVRFLSEVKDANFAVQASRT